VKATPRAIRYPTGVGFTLIELLVVVGIIGLLVALLLTALSRAWAQARFTKCAANLAVQLQAHQAYGNDYHHAKPPLFIPSRMRLDFVSPDIQWDGDPIGQGLLIGTYLSIESLLDPSEALTEDTERDRSAWERRELRPVRSGSSYVYYWRHPPEEPLPSIEALGQGVTYEFASRDGYTTLILDINANENNDYVGEYGHRTWINHPKIGRLNVAYSDWSVRSLPVHDAMLQAPDTDAELAWIREASRRAP